MKVKTFTLIELIQVIVIIGIIAVIAIPKFINYREEAKAARDQGVLGAIRSAIYIYLSEHTGHYPPDWDTLKKRIIWQPPELAYEYQFYVCNNTTGQCNKIP